MITLWQKLQQQLRSILPPCGTQRLLQFQVFISSRKHIIKNERNEGVKCDAWLELQWRQKRNQDGFFFLFHGGRNRLVKLCGGNFLCCHRRYPPTCCSCREPLRRINLSSTFFFCFWLFFHFYFYVVFLLFSFENVSRVHFSSFHCFPPRDVGSRQTGYATNHAQQWGGSLLGSSLSWSLHTARTAASSMPLLHSARAFSSCHTAASSDWLIEDFKRGHQWTLLRVFKKRKKNLRPVSQSGTWPLLRKRFLHLPISQSCLSRENLSENTKFASAKVFLVFFALFDQTH